VHSVSHDEKTEEIYSFTDNHSETIYRLLELSNDEDWFVRNLALERLEEFGGVHHFTESLNRIRQGMSDPNELVRSTCILILGDWKDQESLDQIVKLLTDDSGIVRIAAAEAVGCMGDSSKAKLLEDLLPQIDDDNERVFFYYGLCLLGQEKWLEPILESLTSDYYRTRCAAANSLISCVIEANRNRVLEHLKQALAREPTRAASSSLEGAIKMIESEWQAGPGGSPGIGK